MVQVDEGFEREGSRRGRASGRAASDVTAYDGVKREDSHWIVGSVSLRGSSGSPLRRQSRSVDQATLSPLGH